MRLDEIHSYSRLNLDVVGAEACDLILRDGSRVLDLYGGHCVNVLGAGDAGLLNAISKQWKRLSFCTNLLDPDERQAFRNDYEPNLPAGDWNLFLSNSGAEANESALKIGLGATGRDKVLVFGGAFHGRTAAAVACSDTSKPQFPRAPFSVERVPFGDLEAAERVLDESFGAVLLEPIQSLAGVVDPPEGFLKGLRELCDKIGAALIFDEVQTGSGRLGTFWASDYFGVMPDVFSTAKGVGGGYPMGLTAATRSWTERFDPGLLGSTFGGGPVALAAAGEVARRVRSAGFFENLKATSDVLCSAVSLPQVKRVRGAGLLLGLEMEAEVSAREVRDELMERGVLCGTSGNPQVLRLSPPLTLTPQQAQVFVDALSDWASAPAKPLEWAAGL